MRRVPQEAKSERATFGFIAPAHNAIAVRRVKKTFSARRGTMMEGLRTPTELVMIVIILLSYGCPIQAIVHAYGVDERTVAEWQRRAGEHCQQVHQAVVEVTRKMTSGALEQAQQLLQARRGGTELKTSFIERFNGTVRERLACLTRKCQHAAHRLQTIEAGMYLIGCTYNFCVPHHELSTSKHLGHPYTLAMAAGLTDHIWSVSELLHYQVAPTPWVEPKRVRRRGKASVSDPTLPKRPRGRPCIHPCFYPSRHRDRITARNCSPTPEGRNP